MILGRFEIWEAVGSVPGTHAGKVPLSSYCHVAETPAEPEVFLQALELLLPIPSQSRVFAMSVSTMTIRFWPTFTGKSVMSMVFQPLTGVGGVPLYTSVDPEIVVEYAAPDDIVVVEPTSFNRIMVGPVFWPDVALLNQAKVVTVLPETVVFISALV
jgi:hypothetical protein